MDLDLCNDCHQSVGTPCTLVYLLMLIKLVIYLGSPFILLSSLSEKLCLPMLEVSERCLSVPYCGRILYSFPMLQDLQGQF
jgi:hypothetical protein